MLYAKVLAMYKYFNRFAFTFFGQAERIEIA